jgi:hypothetical protein
MKPFHCYDCGGVTETEMQLNTTLLNSPSFRLPIKFALKRRSVLSTVGSRPLSHFLEDPSYRNFILDGRVT